MEELILSPDQKALKINLKPEFYGTFAEIGAGQEVVRFFFRAGGASGTIAKAMSAYDKEFSDAIYGTEAKNRYVCAPRLEKMLKHEYGLMEERLDRKVHKEKQFFAFANTMVTVNFQKTKPGHGWLGMKFQHKPGAEPSQVTIHVRLHEIEARQQQETVGICGVNLIYGCYFYHENPKQLITSLYDHISRDQMELDMISMTGPAFENTDNRLLSLFLVKSGMTDAVIFSADGKNMMPADILYKKNILTIRGSFRPVTKVNIDMIKNGYKLFLKENRVKSEDLQVLFEITLSNLKMDGDIDEQDFLDRADILCSIGQTVLISNYQEYYKLLEYFSRFTKKRMGLIMGVNNLLDIFNEKYYLGLKGGILEAFGVLFMQDLKIFLYPYVHEDELLNSMNLPIHPRMRPLYNYLIQNGRIIDIEGFKRDYLQIFSRDVLDMIRNQEPGWEEKVPAYVDNIIKEKKLFGYTDEPKVLEEKA